MKSELADCVLEGMLQLHEELSVDPEAPWYVGTPDQTQVLHNELWTLAAEVGPGSSGALVDAWYGGGGGVIQGVPLVTIGITFSLQSSSLPPLLLS